MALSVKNFGGGGSIGSVENLMVANLPTQTVNGITLTNNGNGTYTVNGTATADCYFYHRDVKFNGIAKLVGCPTGGASNKFYLVANVDNSWSAMDIGNGANINGNVSNVCLTVRNGTVCDNLIFKPMLTTNLRATYKEFVKRVGGFVNLFNIDKATFTNYGITCTNNGDGTYTLNGTCTTETATNWMTIGTMSVESGKTYKFSGCPSGGSPSTYGTYITGVGSEHGDGRVFTATSNSIEYGIRVAPQQTLNNLVFKPMLTESLLPEYFDFVKGVSDTFASMGFTKYAIDTYTPTADTNSAVIYGSRYGHTFDHSLGAIPNMAVIWSPSLMVSTTTTTRTYLSSAEQVLTNPSAGDYATRGYTVMLFTNSVSTEIKSWSNQSTLGMCFKSNKITFQVGSGIYLKAGVKYYIMTMA